MDLLDRILAADPPPFAVLHRPHLHPDAAELLTGDVVTVDTLAELPDLPSGEDRAVLAVVPFRQIRERGFDAVQDDVPLLALQVRERAVVPLDLLLARLPEGPLTFRETGYDVPDADYERTVRDVLGREIAAGAGSNFVIHRCLTGRIDLTRETPARAALGALRRLLTSENNAYWTFAVHAGEHTFVGATPERHVSLDAGVARMNPISGTLRHPAGGYRDAAERVAAELAFLADAKERDELAMVVDEELKMMAVVGDRGGRVRGPYLKRMAHLTHTEYVLEGATSMAPREVLTATMFAPTVTGSPIRNACRVIARHERRGRRYYGGVLALIGRAGTDAEGGDTLDAPILIRTAEISSDGVVRVAAGATLVRGSTPASELAETRAKARGILSALHPDPAAGPAPTTTPARVRLPVAGVTSVGASDQLAGVTSAEVPVPVPDEDVARVLAGRNATLARFWLEEQAPETGRPGGPLVTVIDAEDDFTGMLAHVLRALGREVDVRPWTDLEIEPALADRPTLLVLGPGPGDPRESADPRIHALHTLAKTRLANGGPMLGICLGHQVIAHTLGLRVRRLAVPDQGRQRAIDLFGTEHRVGFYNSYVADAPPVPIPQFWFSVEQEGDGGVDGRGRVRVDGRVVGRGDGGARRVHALRGPGVTGLQFHAESVLTTDGPGILDAELARLGS